MAKRNTLHKLKNDDQRPSDHGFPFDFSDYASSSFENDMMSSMMDGLLQTVSQHIAAAVELTQIAVDKNPSQTLTDEDIFETFKKASAVIQEVSPLKSLWKDLM